MPSPPSSLGPYRLLEPLGSGGMGAVYRAQHVETGVRVALKTVLVAHAYELAAIRAEIEALRRLEHPGIVRILDAGVEAASPWYAMELLEGQTLHGFVRALWAPWVTAFGDLIETASTDAPTQAAHPAAPLAARGTIVREGAPAAAGRLPEVLTLVRRLCDPLAYLHELGIVHRDLKPGNVFVRPDGRPVLMDFGLVSRFGGASGREVLEVTGAVAGTAAYMAPEQVGRQRVDARTDLYALGCMLYELVVGRPPFGGLGVAHTLRQHLQAAPAPPSSRVTGVPAALDDLVLRLLAKAPRDRIGHADDVAAALGDLGASGDAEQAASASIDGARRGYLYRPELAGRDEVFAALRARVENAVAGVGGCVLLSGESGVGKTSLVAEVARFAAIEQLAVVVGECQPHGGTSLHPLRALLRAIFDRAVEGGVRATERLFGARARVLAAIEPGLARLPGFVSWPSPAELPADAARVRLLHDLRDTVAAFAAERPLLLALDDLQWADTLSLQFLLAARPAFLRSSAVLILGTFRSDEQPELLSEVLALDGVERLELGRLDEPAVGSMVRDMLAVTDPPAGFVRFLAAQSEGNPFFVAEYLRTAVAEHLLERRAGRWVVGGGAIDDRSYLRLPLPGSLRELVGRRLVGLPAGARALADVASVLGREIDARVLLAASRQDERDAMEAIRELLNRQVLERTDGGRYRFVHDKLREIAYGALRAEERAELHRAAARSLESVFVDLSERSPHFAALARHHQESGDRRAAIEYLERAAEQAARVFADRDVAGFLADALRLDAETGEATDARRRLRWRGDLGMALRRLGRQDEARGHLEQVVRDTGHPVATGSIPATVGRTVGELVLRRSLRHAPVEARPSDPTALAVTAAYNYLAMIAYHRNDVLSQLFYNFAALGLAPRIGPSAEAAHLYASSANIVAFLGLHQLGRRYGRLSHRIADAAEHPLSVGIAHQYTGHLAAFLGDLAVFERDMNRALEVYTAAGHDRFREEALTNLGYLYSLRGELERSRQTFSEIERSGRSRDDVQTTSWGLVGQGRALAMLGELEDALRLFDEAEPLVRDDLGRLDCPAMRSLVLARLGRAERAEADAVRALEIVKANTATSYTTVWSYSGALEAVFLLWDPQERSAAAARHRATAAELCAAFARFGRMIPLARPRVWLWRGTYAWRVGRRAAARRLWRRSIEGARRIGLPIDEAKAHYWMGRSVAGDERVRHLRLAIELFERTRCAPERDEARRFLEQESRITHV